MFFNSINFALFLVIVFVLYWFVANKNLTIQNALLLAASYFFYACWDYRFLFLLVFSTGLDFFTGIKIAEAKKAGSKKFWFLLSVCINLGFLGFFKYYNFFAGSFAEVISGFGFKADFWTLQVILPVGISFYTFHGLSYIIDIYNDKIKPTKNFIDYAVFVSFFPLLVAGPIERATHLLPQIEKPRHFNEHKVIDGLRQILWGLFKKVVIADNCAEFANMTFNDSGQYSGITLIAGAVFFAFQIYGDFSGYSDIALGTARLMGIELIQNFRTPFFSRSVTEFWRRWHISLSSWFSDYVFTPFITARRDWGKWAIVAGLALTFFLSGLWHGAGWTFIIYGCLHGLALIFEFVTKKKRKKMAGYLPGWLYMKAAGLLTFFYVCLAFIFFRSKDVVHAFSYIREMMSGFTHSASYMQVINFVTEKGLIFPLIVVLFFVIEWLGRERNYAIATIGLKWPVVARWSFYYCIILSMCFFATSNEHQFIYFQF